jgi:cellulose synthase/poly-beta-1,6-N-acetylglucosamine synthase-like glycosyltransferase
MPAAGRGQLFQGARGDFFCLIDGDMQLHGAFLREGLAFLAAHPAMAGVGGHVREVEVANAEFAIRAAATAARADMRPGPVDRLDCGGLYRVAALREVGWFADRNLHAFEEMELGARLAARGWELARMDCPGVDHHGHADASSACCGGGCAPAMRARRARCCAGRWAAIICASCCGGWGISAMPRW